ncbi:MAG: DUF4139 domain-containing protein [Alphaproteobacteria bacterium]
MAYRPLAALLLILPLAVADLRAEEQATTANDRTALSLTVYQGNLTLVSEERRLTLRRETERLAVVDVPPAIMPQTVLATGTPADSLRVTGQVFETGVLSPEAILAASVGKTVEVIRTNPATGAETLVPAEVLRANGREALVRIDGGIRTVSTDRIAFGALPPGLRAAPTLVLDLAGGGEAASGQLVLRYLTGGLNWRADYVAELNAEETAIQLAGWVSLTNDSGVPFDNAKLRLVSGSINRESSGLDPRAKEMTVQAMVAADAPAQSVVSDLHVFDFNRMISVGGNETRQLSLLSATRVPVAKEYRLVSNGAHYGQQLSGETVDNPSIRFRFTNEAADGLGRGLPAGTMRFYASDSGGPILVGEDAVSYTAPDEKLFVTVGKAVDIVSERRQTDFRRDGLPRGVSETAHAITLRNAKATDVSVSVIERIPGDWTMLAESQPHSKKSAGEASWDVTVPAGGKAELAYRVRVKF